MFGNSYQNPVPEQDQRPSTAAMTRPKSPPKNIEEWLDVHQGTSTEHAQWPIECSESMSLLEKPLQGESPEHYCVDGDVFVSLQAIKSDLQKHSPWDSTFLDAVDRRLERVEEKLSWYADRFICEGHPSDRQRDHLESVAGGLKNVTNRTFLTDLCDMDLLSSRQLASTFKEKQSFRTKSSQDLTRGDSEKGVDVLLFPGLRTDKMVTLPAKLEPLPILDLVSKAQIPANLSKSWKKVFFTEASSCILMNAFWWIWMDYFKPDQASQASLFDAISENFVVLLHNMDDGHKDAVFMHYPDCLSQAVYSVFCQACPASNKVLNSEQFLNYLTNLVSEWITGVKVGPGEWKRWPRYLLDPYYTSAHSNNRPLSSTRGSRSALTDKDVMSLSMTAPPSQLSREQSRPGYQTQSSRVHFRQTKSTNRERSGRAYNRSASGMSMASGSGSKQWGSPSRSTRGSSGLRRSPSARGNSGRLSAQGDDESTPNHIGPGPIFECVRFSILGRSPLLQHHMIQHELTDFNAPSGPTISRRQVKEVPRPSIGYRELLRRSKETSDKKYAQYEMEMAKSTQESVNSHKEHISHLRKMEKQNKRILTHRYEVAILAERLVAKKKEDRTAVARTNTPGPSDELNVNT